jgi:dTDP-4-amino-4,6-dideoxygalactose transaminase
MSFSSVERFENEIAEFFGSRYAVAVDSCTHGIEISLNHIKATKVTIPVRTYLSIPFMIMRMGLKWHWDENHWQDYYQFGDAPVFDAAVLWRENSYISGTFMSLSFQYQKHLSLGRGGMVLVDDKHAYNSLIKLSYDGRMRNIPWRDQNISSVGYHYYMTPEIAMLGLEKLPDAKNTVPRIWKYEDWPDLREMDVFK